MQGFKGAYPSPLPLSPEYVHHPSKRATCKRCGKHYSEVGAISWGGNCETCGQIASLENVNDLRATNGPYFDHWRRRMAATFGVAIDADAERD